MVAKLHYKNGEYYCGNCYLKTSAKEIPVYCPFCGYEFSNWEEIMIKRMEELENENDVYRED